MAADLVEQYGCKLVVLASLQATLDGLDSARARLTTVPVVGMEPGPVVARAAALAGTGKVRLVVASGCVRGEHLRRELKRGRDWWIRRQRCRAVELESQKPSGLRYASRSATG